MLFHAFDQKVHIIINIQTATVWACCGLDAAARA
jgi:hypothetical protein